MTLDLLKFGFEFPALFLFSHYSAMRLEYCAITPLTEAFIILPNLSEKVAFLTV